MEREIRKDGGDLPRRREGEQHRRTERQGDRKK